MASFSKKEIIVIDYWRQLSRKDILIEAIQLAPNSPDGCYYLGAGLEMDEPVILFGKLFTKRLLYLQVLMLKPDHGPAYNNLAIILQPDETVEIDGVVFNKRALFLEVVITTF